MQTCRDLPCFVNSPRKAYERSMYSSSFDETSAKVPISYVHMISCPGIGTCVLNVRNQSSQLRSVNISRVSSLKTRRLQQMQMDVVHDFRHTNPTHCKKRNRPASMNHPQMRVRGVETLESLKHRNITSPPRKTSTAFVSSHSQKGGKVH